MLPLTTRFIFAFLWNAPQLGYFMLPVKEFHRVSLLPAFKETHISEMSISELRVFY